MCVCVQALVCTHRESALHLATNAERLLALVRECRASKEHGGACRCSFNLLVILEELQGQLRGKRWLQKNKETSEERM